MKKFKFKYENILKIKEKEEERIKNEISNLNFELSELERKKMEILKKQEEYLLLIEKKLTDGCRASELKNIYGNKKYFENELENLESKIVNKNLEIEIKKNEYLEAMKEKKIMEKLRENMKKKYFDKLNKDEEKIIEEIVNYQSFIK